MDGKNANEPIRRIAPDPNAFNELRVTEPSGLRNWLSWCLRASSSKLCIFGPLVALCYVAELLITTERMTQLNFFGGLLVAMLIVGFGLAGMYMTGRQERPNAKTSEEIQDGSDESGNERDGKKDP